ncbi:hypothetical protein [uncultured Thiohalocapsa sp.]|uniref:hypothetical protein n=1 Tax=uncultured Thiohalocapsa sp. TaxID=768990 RepID=UPI0025F5B70B|nr:hypothetical protein [uncultured Thiohalocapsa sp.]
MSGLEHWAAGRLRVHVVDADADRRGRLCRLLRAARLDCRAFTGGRAALRAMSGAGQGAAAPSVLVAMLTGERHWLREARARSPGLVIIGLTPLIRVQDAGHFAPLRNLLNVDYVLPAPVDGAELMAALVLAAADLPSADRLTRAS